jgi:Uma2 family endonuclease
MRATRQALIAPQTEPGSEILFGSVARKVSPSAMHGLLQGRLTTLVSEWAGNRGLVGPEIEFRIGPPGEATRSLLPDVAYLPYDGLSAAEVMAQQYPTWAPALVMEVLSMDDRASVVAHKVDVYRRSGVAVVVLVDPEEQSFTVFDAEGSTRIDVSAIFAHRSLPGLTIPLAPLFAIDDSQPDA